MSDNITPYEAQEKLKSIGVPANTGDREAAVEYFQEHFGVEPIEVIRAVGDDDVFLALNYLARQYDLYNRKEYKSGGEIENYLKERYANSSEEQLEMSYEDYDELVDRIRREYKVASDEAHNIADELLDGYGVQVFAKGGSTYSKGGRVDVDLSSIGLKGHFEYDVVNGLAKVYDIYYVSKNGGYTLVRQTTENPNDFIVGYIDYLQGRDGRYLLEKLKKQDTYAKGGSTYSKGGEIKARDLIRVGDRLGRVVSAKTIGRSKKVFETEFTNPYGIQEITMESNPKKIGTPRFMKVSDADLGRQLLVFDNTDFPLREDINVYYARKGDSSVFWLVKQEDAIELESKGYKVIPVSVPKGMTPRALTTGEINVSTYSNGGEIGDYEVGDIVRIGDTDNENYDDYRGKDLRITHKATNENEHQGFDSSMDGYGLYDMKVVENGEDVPFSLYDYELELSSRQYSKGGSTYSNGGEIKQTAKGAKIASLFERSNEIQRSGFGRGYSKGDLMKLAYGSNYSNVDSALPMGALEAHGIEPMQRYRYVMDYNENSFGEIVDLYEKIAERNPTVEVFNADYVLEGEHPINEAYEKFYKNSKFPYFIQATGSDRFEKGGSTYARGGEIEVGDTVYHAVYTDDDGEKYAIIIVADSKKEAEEYAESVEGEAFTFIRDGVKIKDDEHLNNHLGLIEGSKVVRLDSTYSKGGGVSGWFKGDLSCLNW